MNQHLGDIMKVWSYQMLIDFINRHLRARKGLLQFKDVLLRTRRALSLYKVNGNSALLVLNGTKSLICNSALLALSWRNIHYMDSVADANFMMLGNASVAWTKQHFKHNLCHFLWIFMPSIRMILLGNHGQIDNIHVYINM